MTEKRRGRPPKLIALPVACPECGRVEGHYDDCPAGMGVVPTMNGDKEYWPSVAAAEMVGDPAPFIGGPSMAHVYAVDSPSQAYANRVWSGQSPDVKHAERIARVKRALAGQNLPFEGVVLP